MTKSELLKENKELTAKIERLLSRFKTGRFTYGSRGQAYRGIEIDAAIYDKVTDFLRDLLPEQFCGPTDVTTPMFMVLDDSHQPRVAGQDHYIVQYQYNDKEGTTLLKAWFAVEVD